MSIQDATEAMREFAKIAVPVLEQLEKTILFGWPFDEYPTDTEGKQIVVVFHELGLHEPSLDETRRWFLAGNIVARFRRIDKD